MSKTSSWNVFRSPRTAGIAIVLAGLCGAIFLHFNNPNEKQLIGCILEKTTGLHCPGCGSTRACHALVHGDIPTAFDNNPFLIAALPFILVLSARPAWMAIVHDRWQPFHLSTGPAIFLIVAIVIFGVTRNLPHPAVSWMAP